MTIKKSFKSKIVYRTVMLALLMVGATLTSKAQVAFSVSPGLGLNSAYVGYSVNPKFIPFVSFQYLSFATDYSSSHTGWDYYNNVPKVNTYVSELNARVLLPGLGVKYFLATQNKVKTYATASITMPIVMVKFKEDGVLNPDVEQTVKSISSLGSELGFGAEYYFDNNFSIGGEFGFRMLSGSLEENYDDEYYNPIKDEFVASQSKYTSKGNINPTYTKFTLNFYFLRGAK